MSDFSSDIAGFAQQLTQLDTSSPVELRYGVLAGWDYTVNPATAGVKISGETTITYGVRVLSSYQMKLNDNVVMVKSGGDLWIVGCFNRPIPPPGTVIVMPNNGGFPTDSWILCTGGSYLRSDFKELFDNIGTTFGAVDGTHFTVPNLAALAGSLPYYIRF